MSGSTVRRIAFVVALPCLAALLAGCGGGGGGDSPAPTQAPTPATPMPTPAPPPTPAPTLPPTDAWAVGVCAWQDAATTQIMECACDDTNKLLKVVGVTLNRPPGIALVETETCAMATEGFINSECGEGRGTLGFQNDTFGNCTIQLPNNASEVVQTYCDGTQKFYTYLTKNPSTQPYAENRACEFMVSAFKQGIDTAHPGSCVDPTALTQFV